MGDKPISFKDKDGNFVSAADVWNAEKLEKLFNKLILIANYAWNEKNWLRRRKKLNHLKRLSQENGQWSVPFSF